MKNDCITYGKDTIESQGLSFYLNVLQTAYFKLLPADKEYRVNLLACLHMARGYCVEGSVYRQEIDALHAKVWAELEASLC